MVTAFDKALVAFLIPLIVIANQKWGISLPVDPEILTPLVVGITGLAVYLIPNKEKAA